MTGQSDFESEKEKRQGKERLRGWKGLDIIKGRTDMKSYSLGCREVDIKIKES